MNTTRIGQVASKLMESLDDYPLENAEVGEVLVICEVRGYDSDGDQCYGFHMGCSDGRPWVQRALLNEGIDHSHYVTEPASPDE